jgi:hypothetical protein
LPVVSARPSTDSRSSPTFKIVSIIPGIEIAAPERTETSSGSCRSPNRLPDFVSSASTCRSISSASPAGI